jgi:adenylyltransferase/sulfurtransferase
MGFLQAAEVVKLLLGKGVSLSNRIIYYDALDSDFDTISIDKSTNCDLCSGHPTITTLTEYDNSCETNKNKETS